jgi:precorrin-2/cobalt-factor-2 C20-methyltransferase
MGTLPLAELTRGALDADALVVMKIGRNLPKIREALAAAGKLDRAWLVEYASMEGQTVMPLSEASDRVSPYFSIVVVHGQGRRP